MGPACWALFAVLACALSCAASPCFDYGTCPPCPPSNTAIYSQDVIAPLSFNSNPAYFAFQENMVLAQTIMTGYPGVRSLDVPPLLHITFQYLCCYNEVDYYIIEQVLTDLDWQPVNVTFAAAVCNNESADHLSFVAMLDAASQASLGLFVERIERAMLAAGVPVHVPRSAQEPFHSTIGVVGADYPVAEVLGFINGNVTSWGALPLTINSFFIELPPKIFHANLTEGL